MRHDLWIIERRNEDGSLNFGSPRTDEVFGLGAITGITEDAMANVCFRFNADAILCGDSIALWPKVIDPAFVARRKTW